MNYENSQIPFRNVPLEIFVHAEPLSTRPTGPLENFNPLILLLTRLPIPRCSETHFSVNEPLTPQVLYAYRLREGLNLESAELRKEIRGEATDWTQTLKAYVDCNHMEKVQEIETKIDLSAFFTVNPTMMIDLTVGAVANYSSLEDYAQAQRWYDRMRKLIVCNPLNVEVMQSTGEVVVRVGFNIGERSYLTFKQVYDNTRDAFKDFDFKKSIMPPDRLAEVGSQFEALQRLNRYLASWSEQQSGHITASKYIEKRRQHHAIDIGEFGDRLGEYTERLALPGRDQAGEIHRLMLDVVKRIECKEIEKVFDVDL